MTITHYRILAVCWTLGVIIAYSIPTTPPLVTDVIIGWDKVAHFVLFVGFGFLWMHGLHRRRPSSRKATSLRRAALLFAVGAAFSVAAELYQGLLPRRATEIGDATANILGLLTAILFFRLRYPPISSNQ